MKSLSVKVFVTNLLIGVMSISLSGGTVSSVENIIFPSGKAVLEKTGKTVFTAVFQPGNYLEKPSMNYLKRTSFKVKNHQGKECLFITGAKDKSAEWGLQMPEFEVEGNKEFILEMDVCGTISMFNASGRKSFSNRYYFLDEENRQCGDEEYFYYETLFPTWTTVKVIGKIPAGAAKMILQFGGAPVIEKGGHLAYSKIMVRQYDQKTPAKKNGFFISRPILLEKGAVLTYKADNAAGSTLSFEIQTASDVNGKPGVWSDWKKYDGKPITADAQWLRYKAVFQGRGKSVVLHEVKVGSFVDKNFSIKKDDHAPVVTRISPSPVQDPMAEVVFRVSDETGVNFNALRCSVNKKDITSKLIRKGHILTYKPEQPLKKLSGDSSKSLNEFTFKLEDLNGNKAELNEYCCVGEAYKGNKLTFRDDGMMIVNGKEFFPLGFFSGSPYSEDLMKTLKDNGVNFLQSFEEGKHAAEMIRLAEKYDIKLCIRYWLIAYRNSKAVVSFYSADDSRRYTEYFLKGIYNMVRSFAPDAGIGHSEMPLQSYGSLYAPRIWTCDMSFSQLYPISGKPSAIRCGAQRIITDVKTMVRDRRNSAYPSNCILSGPQTFCEPPIWTRYPTKEEVKVMAYLSVIHGANGVIYFSLKDSRKSPEESVFKAALETLKELSVLTPALLSRKTVVLPPPVVVSGPAKDKDKNESVNLLARQVGKDLYILVANSADQPVTVRFSGINGHQAVLPFENRSIAIQNGSMSDQFGKYSVHVYKVTLK